MNSLWKSKHENLLAMAMEISTSSFFLSFFLSLSLSLSPPPSANPLQFGTLSLSRWAFGTEDDSNV